MSNRLTEGQLMRLDAVADHLDIRLDPEDDCFNEAVISSCLTEVAPIIASSGATSGEEILAALGNYYSVKFEEVRSTADIERLERKYLKGQREPGFAQLQIELANPNVDALLFQRQRAKERDRDKWVAVLNLQETETRSFWNRAHELSHRIAEPPQGLLPFKRHGLERTEPIERLMDLIAAEVAFFPDVFVPLVEDQADSVGELTFAVVQSLRDEYAATSSLLSSCNAVVNAWPRPATSLTTKIEGRIRNPSQGRALRAFPQTRNAAARDADELYVIPRMRVPLGSVIHEVHRTGIPKTAVEDLGNWSTSAGKNLKNTRVLISATPAFAGSMYVIISMV